jgi:hypothetical protein
MIVLAANLSQVDRFELRSFSEARGIAYWEMPPEIISTSTMDEHSDLIFGEYDKHWNAKANALIAEKLLSQMSEAPTFQHFIIH